jgi:cytochrome c6
MTKRLWIFFLSLLIFITVYPPLTFAQNLDNIDQGAKIFQINCVGCHPNGNNIIRRGKNLKKKTLKRNGFDSIEAIANLVSNGKNNMSAFKDRLTPQQIDEVAKYVLQKAETNWK